MVGLRGGGGIEVVGLRWWGCNLNIRAPTRPLPGGGVSAGHFLSIADLNTLVVVLVVYNLCLWENRKEQLSLYRQISTTVATT